MATQFGAPIDDPESQHPAAEVSSDAPQELIDPNDPRLVSEDLNANPDADAYAVPPPPPDQKWRVKLKLVQKEVQGQKVDYVPAKWGQNPPQLVFVAGVEASIIDPTGKYDGLKARDFNVSTFIGRDGATKVMTILGKLKKPDGSPWAPKGARMSSKAWMDLLVRALAGEPECGIETVWEWSCEGCGKEAKAKHEAYPRSTLGMHKFPEHPDPEKRRAGMRSPEMKCQINGGHGYSRARVNIGRFMSLDELKGAPAK